MKHVSILLFAALFMLNQGTAQNVGQVAPDFTLKNLNNEDYKLSDNKGKVILVFLVGYSCPLCIASAPDVKSGLLNVYGSNTNFQALVIDTWDGSTSAVNGFKNSTGLNAVYLQKGASVATSWSITYDRLVVIDSQGKMIFKGTRAARSDVAQAKNAIDLGLNNLTTSAFVLPANQPAVLGQIFPNPLTGNSTIEFTTARDGEVSLKIMDLTGKVVATPIQQLLPAGNHSVSVSSNQFQKGIYLYQLQTANYTSTKKMVVQ